MTQMTMDLTERRRTTTGRRHRAIILTTSRRDFEKSNRMATGDETEVVVVNDIVSTTRGQDDGPHAEIRRSRMVRNAIAGGHDRVYIRYAMGFKIPCRVIEVQGEDDDSAVAITIARI